MDQPEAVARFTRMEEGTFGWSVGFRVPRFEVAHSAFLQQQDHGLCASDQISLAVYRPAYLGHGWPSNKRRDFLLA